MNDGDNYIHKYYTSFLSSKIHEDVSTGTEYYSSKQIVRCQKNVLLDLLLKKSKGLNSRYHFYLLLSTTRNSHHIWIKSVNALIRQIENVVLMVLNSLSPIISLVSSILARTKLRNFHWLPSTGYLVPGRINWLVLYLKFLQWMGYISILRRIDETKRFPEEATLLLRKHISCILSCIETRSTPIGLHVPTQRNSPEDIYPPFL